MATADTVEEVADAENTNSPRYGVGLNLVFETKSTEVVLFAFLVSVDGIGPSTSVLSGQRSTTELHARSININKNNKYTQTHLDLHFVYFSLIVYE